MEEKKQPQLAMNVEDLMTIALKFSNIAYSCMVEPLLTDTVVVVDKNMISGIAIVLNQDATIDRLTAIRDVLVLKGYDATFFRVYKQGRKGGWSRVKLPKK